MSVLSRSTVTPPSVVSTGAKYIVPTGATGIWAGKSGQIAHFLTAGWTYYVPLKGAATLVLDEDTNVQFDGIEWRALSTEARRPSYIADEAISALRVVRVSTAGHVVYARHPEIESRAPVGITVTAAISGGRVNVATSGEITDPLWSWTAGDPVLLGPLGTLTQTPTTGFLVQVAEAINATTIVVRICPPILLAV